MKNAALKKEELFDVLANDNDAGNELEMLAHYRAIAIAAHAACTSVDMDAFEEKYGLCSFA